MTYRSGRSKKTQKYINLLLGLIAFFLLVYFWGEFRSIVYPAVEASVREYGETKNMIKIMPGFIASYFSSRNHLVKEKDELERAIEHLENALAEKEAFIRERNFIKEGETAELPNPVMVMYPLAQDVTNVYSTMLLSRGFKDGIEKGGVVYVRGLQPVCEIVEVYDQTSLCELLSKGGREAEGVTSSSSISLVLTGAGGGNFVAEAPKGTEVSVGEDVYLRSNPAFKIGTIISIQDDQQATGAKLFIRGAYNPVTSSVFYVHTRYAP